MKSFRNNLFILVLSVLIVFSVHSQNKESPNSKIENGYEIHFNALSTSFLQPEVAKNYKIGRSKTKGFVNIAVLKLNENKVSTPVMAEITIDAKNLYGQNKNLSLRKISENSGAIYYIGVFSVSSRETIVFNAQVIPEGSKKPIEIKFNQEFFTD